MAVTITRAYTRDKRIFGDVTRYNTLGLQTFAPTVQLDDGKFVAYFGETALDSIVDPLQRKTLSGEDETVPIDVRTVGGQYLTMLGIPADQQREAMRRWLAMAPSVQEGYIATYDGLDKSDMQAVGAFAQGLYDTLTQTQ